MAGSVIVVSGMSQQQNDAPKSTSIRRATSPPLPPPPLPFHYKPSSSSERTSSTAPSDTAANVRGTYLSKMKDLPSPTSPLAKHFLLTVTTAVLASLGFLTGLVAALSCDVVRADFDAGSLAASLLEMEESYVGIGSGAISAEDSWYYNELLSNQSNQHLSMGVFCSGDFSFLLKDQSSNTMRQLSGSFLVISLILGAIVMNLSCAISTLLPTTERIWNGISYFSSLAFLCEMPVFFILDSPPCNNSSTDELLDFTCSLSSGSFSLFVSMVSHLVLAIITQWKEAPDWKGEYELWRLIRENRNMRNREEEEYVNSLDERDVELGMGGKEVAPTQVAQDVSNVKQQQARATASKEVFLRNTKKLEAMNNLPCLSTDNKSEGQPAESKPLQVDRRLAKSNRKKEVSLNFVGKYINVEQKHDAENDQQSPVTQSRFGIPERSPISPITHGSGETALAEAEDCAIMKNIEKKQKDTMSPLITIPTLVRNVSNGSNRSNACEKEDRNFMFYGVDGDLTSIESGEDGDEKKLLLSVKSTSKPSLGDASISRSVRADPQGTGHPFVSSSSIASSKNPMKSMFRKKGKNNANKCYGFNGDRREEIQEQWMLEETSLARSNSDDLLFLDGSSRAGPDEKVGSVHSRQSSRRSGRSNIVPSAVSPSPPQIRRSLSGAVVVSPSNEDVKSYNSGMIPSEASPIISVGKHTTAVIVSPEKDDPSVEMYPSDASLSTLSLPSGSDAYSSSDNNDGGSRRHRHQPPPIKTTWSNDEGNSSDSSASEISQIIEGVRKINRKTSGKITPLNKRRRRRKSRRSGDTGISSCSSYSSQSHGSLLDEVIDEEGELNDSGEQVKPVVPIEIEASSPRNSTKKKSKSPRSNRSSGDLYISDGEHSGYESGYARGSSASSKASSRQRSDSNSDYSAPIDNAKRVGYTQFVQGEVAYVSEAESRSSLAARARRTRILSKKQVHIEPDTIPSVSSPSASPQRRLSSSSSHTSDYKSTRSHYSSKSTSQQSFSAFVQTRSQQYNNEDHPDAGYSDQLSARSNISWQARKSRMSRLRLQRGGHATKSSSASASTDFVVRAESVIVASDEGSI